MSFVGTVFTILNGRMLDLLYGSSFIGLFIDGNGIIIFLDLNNCIMT